MKALALEGQQRPPVLGGPKSQKPRVLRAEGSDLGAIRVCHPRLHRDFEAKTKNEDLSSLGLPFKTTLRLRTQD